ncbi:MAG: chemotaxis protein CheX [Verrucomicrobiae bacterium]|nr:chemotaxis protein CheX [Verrucomicrobiae bacterium]
MNPLSITPTERINRASLRLPLNLRESVEEVFCTYLHARPIARETDSVQEFRWGRDSLIASVGLVGQEIVGNISLWMDDALATHCAALILERTVAEVTVEAKRDMIGELSNMLAGDLKARLTEGADHCAMTLPMIMHSGASVVIEGHHATHQHFQIFGFQDQRGTFAVSVHLSMQKPSA